MAPGVERGERPQGERSRDPQDAGDGGPVPGTLLATERLATPSDSGEAFARVADIEGEPLAIGVVKA